MIVHTNVEQVILPGVLDKFGNFFRLITHLRTTRPEKTYLDEKCYIYTPWN